MDVTNEAAVADAIQKTISELGRFDLLVNNAGILVASIRPSPKRPGWTTSLNGRYSEPSVPAPQRGRVD
jgi:NAD(P)-dependent dehydrogenase (short-subunit alcohol dehydrogenase family)